MVTPFIVGVLLLLLVFATSISGSYDVTRNQGNPGFLTIVLVWGLMMLLWLVSTLGR